MTRRELFPTLAGLAAVAAAANANAQQTPYAVKPQALDPKPPPAFLLKPKQGRLKQSICTSVFPRGLAFEDQCKMAAELGFFGIDLQTPDKFATLKKYGLVSTMTQGGGGQLPEALNHKENHAAIEVAMHKTIDLCAEGGSPNLITFSGNRRGISEAEGMDNCVAFLNRVKAHAEDKNVNVCMELLNSRVNHKDYQNDHVDWGVEVCKRVDSSRVKLLFDIYHMQIMDGDIVRRIQENFKWMGHFHTGGVPGRHEIDNDSQELNYHWVAKALADMGYPGFIAHEYSPVRDAVKSLTEARDIFTV